jgi:hypothetical protein
VQSFRPRVVMPNCDLDCGGAPDGPCIGRAL